MALQCCSFQFPLFPSLQSNNCSKFQTPPISKPITLTPNYSSSPPISNHCHHQPLHITHAPTSIHISPSTGIFIKGLPESATEGRLKKAFSQFGQVSQVKVVVEKVSKQPIGSAFVWFTSKESAELAVEEMNGKFFDGRFILVKVAEPGLSKNREKRKRYRF